MIFNNKKPLALSGKFDDVILHCVCHSRVKKYKYVYSIKYMLTVQNRSDNFSPRMSCQMGLRRHHVRWQARILIGQSCPPPPPNWNGIRMT
jgi:hypothetical protein